MLANHVLDNQVRPLNQKCGSSKMKRALSKDEEEAAFRRKNKKDPNPNRSGKAINVKTEETVREATYPSDFAKGSGVAKKKTGRPIQTRSTPRVVVVEKTV